MSRIVNFYFWLLLSFAPMCVIKNVFIIKAIANLNYRGKYSADIKNYEIVFPQRVNEDGSFISHPVPHRHSKRSTKELDFIFYKIPIGGKDYLIELTPNRKLISPGAVVEIHSENVRQSKKKKQSNESAENENLKKMFDSVNIRKLKNTECHFYGRVKGENISKAALSTCYGLAGFIQIKKGFYTIEPVAEHNPLKEDAYPHILYEADNFENSSVCQTVGQLSASIAEQIIRKRRDSNFAISVPMYIETLIVMDKTMVSHHEDSDCENYVLTVFNMAFNLFHDASLGLMMTLTIVRIIRLEIEDDEMNLNVNADAEKTLQYFQAWQNQINPGDDSHPNHHDIAVLLTRINVCYSPSSCGLLGLSTIGKACDPQFSAALCEDNGLRLGFVIAHEIGHLLGADHDSTNSTCNGTNAEGKKTVMNPQIPTTSHAWSACSRGYFTAFFENGLGTCLLDEPEEHHFNVQDLLPGVMYNADYQCKSLIGSNTRECEMGSTCESLNCYVPGYACIVTNKPPVDGTGCGENMWCHNTKCLVVGERPGVVDGNWGEWSAWSDCSRTCGSGVASSVRRCDKPVPSNGGKSCVGERKKYKICASTLQNHTCIIKAFVEDYNSPPKYFRFDISEEVNVSFVGKPCETGRPSFRDIQCGEFNDWVYPEDETTHTWKAFYLHNDNPCTLYCISENKQIAALKPRVIDGTMCYRGIRDICVSGTCKSLPCDLHFDSNAVEDACGICHGDGTGCEFSEGIETFMKLPKGLTKLVNIPSGTRNIRVEETMPTLARIIVRDTETKEIYVKGKNLGLFSVPGSQAWMGMIKKNQEALNIPGPVSKPLTVWIQRLENVTVRWSMALPVEQQRKPEFAWDFLKWGPCSAKCGPGIQKSNPSCMEEKAGMVEDSFCADLEVPPSKVRPCQIAPCEPRWMLGDWRGCEPNAMVKQRKRVVFCVKPIGEGEGESQIVLDSFCPQPKPHNVESCENRQKREDSEYGKENDQTLWDLTSYTSEAADFDFHKRYDDYLTYFAALSVPQRKSETIPLSVVFSPHFKRYFRIIEEPERRDNLIFKRNENLSIKNSSLNNFHDQSKISQDFYKSVFSGEKIDANNIQSKVTFADDNRSAVLKDRKRKKKALDQKSDIIQHDFRKKNARHLLNYYPNYKKSVKKSKIQKRKFDKKQKRFISRAHHAGFRGRVGHYGRHSFMRSKKQDVHHFAHKLMMPSFKKTRSHKGKFHLHNEKKKSFNYTSPDLMNVIDNLSENDVSVKKKYLKLLNQDKEGSFSQGEKKRLRDFNMDLDTSNKDHKTGHLSKPFLQFSESSEKEDNTKAQKENIKKKEAVKLCRPWQFRDFDGSGLRKFKSDKVEIRPQLKYESKIKDSKIEDLSSHENAFVSNPFDPLHVKKPGFKGRSSNYENKYFDKQMRRLHKKLNKKQATPYFQKNEVSHYHDRNFNPKRLYSTCKRKRSSKKWRKSSKISRDLINTNSGIERKNYLNNLFRDIHPKVKQEVLSPNVKPLINVGQVVIDKDVADDQQLDILFQDNEVEESTPKYTQLPRPPLNEKKITLRGQAVFEFFKGLEPRNNREAPQRSTNVMEDKTAKAETEPSKEEKKSEEEVTTSAGELVVGLEPRNDREQFYRSTMPVEDKNVKTESAPTKEEKKSDDATTLDSNKGTPKVEISAVLLTTTIAPTPLTPLSPRSTANSLVDRRTTPPSLMEGRSANFSTTTSANQSTIRPVTKPNQIQTPNATTSATKIADAKKNETNFETTSSKNCTDFDIDDMVRTTERSNETTTKKCEPKPKKKKKEKKKKCKKKKTYEDENPSSASTQKSQKKKRAFRVLSFRM